MNQNKAEATEGSFMFPNQEKAKLCVPNVKLGKDQQREMKAHLVNEIMQREDINPADFRNTNESNRMIKMRLTPIQIAKYISSTAPLEFENIMSYDNDGNTTQPELTSDSYRLANLPQFSTMTPHTENHGSFAAKRLSNDIAFKITTPRYAESTFSTKKSQHARTQVARKVILNTRNPTADTFFTSARHSILQPMTPQEKINKRDASVKVDRKLLHQKKTEADHFFDQFDNDTIKKQRAKSLLRARKVGRPLPLVTTIGGKLADHTMASNSSRWTDVHQAIHNLHTVQTTERQKEVVSRNRLSNEQVSVPAVSISNKRMPELDSVGQLLKIGEKLASETRKSRIAGQIEVLARNQSTSPCQGSLIPMVPTIKSPVAFANSMKNGDRSRSCLGRNIDKFKTLNGQGICSDDPESLLKLFFDKNMSNTLDQHNLRRMFALPSEINEDLLEDTKTLQQNFLKKLNEKKHKTTIEVSMSKDNQSEMPTEDPKSREMSPEPDSVMQNTIMSGKSAAESDRFLIAESRFIRPDLINVQSKTFEELEEYYKHLSGMSKQQTTQENLISDVKQSTSRVTAGNVFLKRNLRQNQFPVKKSTLTYRKPQQTDFPAASTPWRQTNPTIKKYISQMNNLKRSRFNGDKSQGQIKQESKESRSPERQMLSPRQNTLGSLQRGIKTTQSQMEPGSTERGSEPLQQIYHELPPSKTPNMSKNAEKRLTDLVTTNYDSEEQERKAVSSTQQTDQRPGRARGESMKIDDASFGYNEETRGGGRSRAPPSPEYQVRKSRNGIESQARSRSGCRENKKANQDIELDRKPRTRSNGRKTGEPSTPASAVSQDGSHGARQRYKLRNQKPAGKKRKYVTIKQKEMVLVPIPQVLSIKKDSVNKLPLSEVFQPQMQPGVSKTMAEKHLRLPANVLSVKQFIAESFTTQSPHELLESGPETLRTTEDKMAAATAGPVSPFKMSTVRPSPNEEAFSFHGRQRNSQLQSPMSSVRSANRHHRLANVETMNRDLSIQECDNEQTQMHGTRLSPMQSNQQFGTRNLLEIQNINTIVKRSGAAVQVFNSARRNLAHAASELQKTGQREERRNSSQYQPVESKHLLGKGSDAKRSSGMNTLEESKHGQKEEVSNKELKEQDLRVPEELGEQVIEHSDKAIQENAATYDPTNLSASNSKDKEDHSDNLPEFPEEELQKVNEKPESASQDVEPRMKPAGLINKSDEDLTADKNENSREQPATSIHVFQRLDSIKQDALQIPISQTDKRQPERRSPVIYQQLKQSLKMSAEPITEEEIQSIESEHSTHPAVMRLASSFQTHHDSLFVRGRRRSNVCGGVLADDRRVECAVGSSFKKVISLKSKRCIAIQASPANSASNSPCSRLSPSKQQTMNGDSVNSFRFTSPINERTLASPEITQEAQASPGAVIRAKQVAFNFMSHDEAARASLYSLGPTVVEYPIFPGSNLSNSKYGVGVEPSSPSPKRRDIILKKKFGPAAVSPSGSPSPRVMSPKAAGSQLQSRRDSPLRFKKSVPQRRRQELKLKQTDVMDSFVEPSQGSPGGHSRSPRGVSSPFVNNDVPINPLDFVKLGFKAVESHGDSNRTIMGRCLSPQTHTLAIEHQQSNDIEFVSTIREVKLSKPSPTRPTQIKASKPTISSKTKVRVSNLPLAGITPIQEEAATSRRSETASEIVNRLLRVEVQQAAQTKLCKTKYSPRRQDQVASNDARTEKKLNKDLQ